VAEPEPLVATGGFRVLGALGRHSRAALVVLVLLGTLRIAATYGVLSHTFDEPAHIACGMEWLSQGTWELDPNHSPLGRIPLALGPYLASGRPSRLPTMADVGLADLPVKRVWNDGLAILHRDGRYDRNLTLARIGVLPFFWIASLAVYLWARRSLGTLGAALAAFFFTFLPPILAHSGLATNDVALTAFLPIAFAASLRWLAEPSLGRGLAFGLATGVATLCKFSALPFLAAGLAVALLLTLLQDRGAILGGLRGARRYVLTAPWAAAAFGALVWACYRFSFGPVPALHGVRLPAPEFWNGLWSVYLHNRRGDATFLLGERSDHGWWFFYPVVLAVKTPLPFLLLAAYGGLRALRGGEKSLGTRLALALSAGIIAVSLTLDVDLGVRYILPAYFGLSIAAAAGGLDLLRQGEGDPRSGAAFGVLALWMTASSLLVHPDYLAYFNALAGPEPENVLAGADLDWGQDIERLARRLQEVHAESLAFSPFAPLDLAAMGLPRTVPNDPRRPTAGWNAVSLSVLKTYRLGLSEEGPAPWPEEIPPQERIGRGIWLYYFAPRGKAP
jgi:4-amino-4-deoxy-L-arabinose transferase-like glycosyltransferase